MRSLSRNKRRCVVAAALLLLMGCLLWCGGNARHGLTQDGDERAGHGSVALAGASNQATSGSAAGAASPADGDSDGPVNSAGGSSGAGGSLDPGAPPPCVPQPDASWIPGDADTIAVEPTPAPPDAGDAGCYRDPYLPDNFEPPCVQPRPKPNCKDGWCTLEPGCFIMGDPWCEWGRAASSSNPVQVTLTHPFRIQQVETTQREWEAEGFPNPSGLMGNDTGDCMEDACPVGNVTWMEALAFANARSRRDGVDECYALDDCEGEVGVGFVCDTIRSTYPSIYDCPGYRLPTGAEWEYAARAGTRTTVYSGEVIARAEMFVCVDDPVLSPIAWYCANAGPYTHPGCQKLPNDWGIYDMIGNSNEWQGSLDEVYGGGPHLDWGGALDAEGVLDPGFVGVPTRGGGWNQWPNAVRAGTAPGNPAYGKGPGGGFRLAQTVFREKDAGD